MSFNSANIGKIIYSLVNGTIPSYPVIAPQTTQPPYLVYNILSNDPDDTKDGAAWVDRVTVLLSVYESTYALTAAKAISIRNAIDAKPSGIYGGVPVDSIVFITESDDYDFELKYYVKTIEYLIRLQNGANLIPVSTYPVTATTNFNQDGLFFTLPYPYTLTFIIITAIGNINVYIGTAVQTPDINIAVIDPSNPTIILVPNVKYTADQKIYISSDDWTTVVQATYIYEIIN